MVVLRIAVPEDADAFYELHRACWREAYAGLMPAEAIERAFSDRVAYVERRRDRLGDPARPTWLAEKDGVAIGFATAGPARAETPPVEFELYGIYARSAYWGQGVGAALLQAAVGDRACYLWVLDGNDRAIAFYRRHGFVLDGGREDHPEGLHLRMVRRSDP